jgi:peptidoglycan/xylan/chitin deacetylase (PgdA/CDA1 family)
MLGLDSGPAVIALGRRLFPGCIWEGPSTPNAVALTFDDGPDPRQTPRVLDLLDQHAAKATFFWLGTCLEQAPDLAREIAARGHGIGLHGATHRSFLFMSDRALRSSLDRLRDRIAEITGLEPATLRDVRPPFGHLRPGLDRRLTSWGYRVVQCSVLPADWEASPDIVARRVAKAVQPGAIIALHDGGLAGRRAPATAKSVLEAIRERGFQLATLDQLICGASPTERSERVP